mgnify:CR=1 FL=1
MKCFMQEPVMARDGSYSVTFTGIREDLYKRYEELKDKPVSVELKEYKNPRSLTANAYAWVLIGKISEKMRMSAVEYYRRAIRECAIKTNIVCVQNHAAQSLIESWGRNGIGSFCEMMDSKIDGCTNVMLYDGSSTFNSSEMARFINYIVQDAESLGIPTVTDEEMNRMLGRWKRVKKNQAGTEPFAE